jgi:hypothetical protein
MVTRNLYELPDVCATLLIALNKQDTQLLARTVLELVESGVDPTPYLVLGWLLSPAIPEKSKACSEAYMTGDLGQLVAAVQQLLPYDLPSIPSLAPEPKASSSTAKATWNLPWSPAANARFELAMVYAIKTKNHQHAAYLISALPTNFVPRLIKTLGVKDKLITLYETTEYPPLKQRVVEHVFASLAFDGTPTVKKQLPIKTKGRTFSIPESAYSLWNVKPTSPDRLLGLPLHILDNDATPFWKNQVKRFQISRKENDLQFPDDATLERFYEENFPNDIPDEWSKQERAKSHPCPLFKPQPNPWLPAFHCNT